MVEKVLLIGASQQALCEVLGYEEGKAYYLILTKNEKQMNKEFSYSKKYRILKKLFKLGALGKLKSESKDFFSYMPLPPSFLHTEKIHNEIIKFLEEIYLKNYKTILATNFSQLILKDEKGLVYFLLRYIMEDNAKILGTQINSSVLGKDIEKVTIKTTHSETRKAGIIDQNFVFEFSSIRNKNSYDYVGYIAAPKEKDNNYIKMIENEFD